MAILQRRTTITRFLKSARDEVVQKDSTDLPFQSRERSTLLELDHDNLSAQESKL